MQPFGLCLLLLEVVLLLRVDTVSVFDEDSIPMLGVVNGLHNQPLKVLYLYWVFGFLRFEDEESRADILDEDCIFLLQQKLVASGLNPGGHLAVVRSHVLLQQPDVQMEPLHVHVENVGLVVYDFDELLLINFVPVLVEIEFLEDEHGVFFHQGGHVVGDLHILGTDVCRQRN